MTPVTVLVTNYWYRPATRVPSCQSAIIMLMKPASDSSLEAWAHRDAPDLAFRVAGRSGLSGFQVSTLPVLAVVIMMSLAVSVLPHATATAAARQGTRSRLQQL